MAGEVEEKAADALEAETELAEAQAAAAASTAAATAVATAETAVALAKEESAVAIQRAAETIGKTHEEISWLKNQSSETINHLSGLSKRQETQEAAINAIAENQQKMLEALTLLTPKPSTDSQAETVNPQNEEEDARQKAEESRKAEAAKPKRMFL